MRGQTHCLQGCRASFGGLVSLEVYKGKHSGACNASCTNNNWLTRWLWDSGWVENARVDGQNNATLLGHLKNAWGASGKRGLALWCWLSSMLSKTKNLVKSR
eukprot:1042545-Amphidinium_carterae.3